MNIHIIGIKGWGTSALAQILKARGNRICGSDTLDAVPSDAVLKQAGISVEPFGADAVSADLDRVIYSTAYGDDHPERIRCSERGIQQVSYPEAVGEIFNPSYGISVCGTHGKTTSSAMMAHVLKSLGSDPTAIIGSLVVQFGSNALAGSSPYFVLETDEYQNKFRYYHPKAVLLTSVEWDHPDFFPTEEDYRNVFRSFLANSSIEHGVCCVDDAGVRDVIRSSGREFHGYGESEDAQYRMVGYGIKQENTTFTVVHKGKEVGVCTVPLIGRHNALNALGVFALCDTLGIDGSAEILQAIGTFAGTERRLEYKGTHKKTRVYVDYGHHPTEVRVTLDAVRERFPDKKIWCVFGPHTFSRTLNLLAEFARSFMSVDRTLLLDIYGAREKEGAIHAHDVVEAIHTQSHNAEYAGSIDRAVDMLNGAGDDIDILVCMGASEDVWKVAETFLKE